MNAAAFADLSDQSKPEAHSMRFLGDAVLELGAMADKVGVRRKWIQHPDTYEEHYDVSLSARAKAVAAGAEQITVREYAAFVNRRKGPLCE